MRVLLAGGGTAGHTSPLIATADALRRLVPEAEITCLGTPRGLETRVVPEAGYPLELIPPVPLPRRPNADLFKVPSRLRGAVKETLAIFDRVRPDVVVGYGGYVSMPAYLAARRRKLPLVIHEQNTAARARQQGRRPDRRPGRGQLPRHPAAAGGVRRPPDPPDDLPARPGRAAGRGPGASSASTPTGRPCWSPAAPRARAGSTSRSPAPPAPWATPGVQVLHVVGPEGRGRARAPTGVPYVVVDFVDRMDLALRRRRPGRSAGRAPPAVTEAAAVGLPAVFVPLPIGNGEQELNARPVVDGRRRAAGRRRRPSPPSGWPPPFRA